MADLVVPPGVEGVPEIISESISVISISVGVARIINTNPRILQIIVVIIVDVAVVTNPMKLMIIILIITHILTKTHTLIQIEYAAALRIEAVPSLTIHPLSVVRATPDQACVFFLSADAVFLDSLSVRSLSVYHQLSAVLVISCLCGVRLSVFMMHLSVYLSLVIQFIISTTPCTASLSIALIALSVVGLTHRQVGLTHRQEWRAFSVVVLTQGQVGLTQG